MENKNPVIIRIKDIMKVTNQSYRSARRVYNEIRKNYNYIQRSYISLKHYCEYTKLEEAVVLQRIGWPVMTVIVWTADGADWYDILWFEKGRKRPFFVVWTADHTDCYDNIWLELFNHGYFNFFLTDINWIMANYNWPRILYSYHKNS